MKNKNWKKEIPWDNHEWAEYACLNFDGTMKLFRDNPICMESYKEKFWFPRYSDRIYEKRKDLKGHEEYMQLIEKEKTYLFVTEWTSNDYYEYEGDWRNTLIKRGDK